MFGLASGFYQSYLIPPEVTVLIVGLDDSGKSTLLERVKVTDFNSKMSVGKRIAVQQIPNGFLHTEKKIDRKDHVSPVQQRKSPSKAHALEMKPSPKRRLFSCPAPKMYQQARVDSDEETELIESKDNGEDVISSPTNGNIEIHDGIIDLPYNSVEMSPATSPERRQPGQSGDLSNDGLQEEIPNPSLPASNHSLAVGESDVRELDLKAGKKMFPLHLIRPTIGMNLGKIEACGAKVRLMDLGGQIKMRPLWERYYNDIHAITFVIDVSPTCEVSKLMEARAFYRCMRDDESLRNVPILIFANKTDTRGSLDDYNTDEEDENYGLLLEDTSLLDIAELFLSHPKGASRRDLLTKLDAATDDENVALFAGSAKTGEGVRAAFDWLIQMGATRVREAQT